MTVKPIPLILISQNTCPYSKTFVCHSTPNDQLNGSLESTRELSEDKKIFCKMFNQNQADIEEIQIDIEELKREQGVKGLEVNQKPN